MFEFLTMHRLRISLSFLWMLDTIFTVIFVNLAGLDVEGNPLMRLAFIHTGNVGFVLIKLAVIALFWYYTTLIERAWIKWVTVGLNLIMFYIAILGAMTVSLAISNTF